MTTKTPTPNERIAGLLRLVDALDEPGNYRIGIEVLRFTRFIAPWSIRQAGHGMIEIEGPQTRAFLARDSAIDFLRKHWLPEAVVELRDAKVERGPDPELSAIDKSFLADFAVDHEAKTETGVDVIVDVPSQPAARITVGASEFREGIRLVFEDTAGIAFDDDGPATELHLARRLLAPLRDALDAFLQQKPVAP